MLRSALSRAMPSDAWTASRGFMGAHLMASRFRYWDREGGSEHHDVAKRMHALIVFFVCFGCMATLTQRRCCGAARST